MSDETGGERDELAPVIPLFGSLPVVERGPEARVETPPSWRTTWDDDPAASAPEGLGPVDETMRSEREAAEGILLRKLRTRQLSVSEARAVAAERSLDRGEVDALLHDFVRRGYLDDARLAEQLVTAAVERKGQGRRVIAQSLAKRGIPRDVVDAALAELPDDDAERALAYARQKAPAMARLDHDAALRRLAGQLARRGYGAAALDAARQALAEL